VWACVIVAAEDADKAKQAVIFDESGHTWDNPAEDYDSALRTTIEGCREISDEEIEQLGDNPARERLHDFIHSTDTCQRKIEMSPGAQSRDDTPVGGGRDEGDLNCILQ